MRFTIFYSWQSWLPNRTNRGLIGDALSKSITTLRVEGESDFEHIIDRDTLGISGSPDIALTILSKIDAADAMIADVSVVNLGGDLDRMAPNPNVVLEVGYALKVLGPNRIILVMNTAYGGLESLPFDLSKLRVLKYSFSDQDDKKLAMQGLVRDLTNAITLVERYHEAQIKERSLASPVVTLRLMFQDGTTDMAFDRRLPDYEGGMPDVTAKIFVENIGQVAANEVLVEMTQPDDMELQVITAQSEWSASNRGYASDGSLKLRSGTVLQGERQMVCQVHAIVRVPRSGASRRRFEVPWRIRVARPAQIFEGSLVFDIRCQALPEQLTHSETVEEFIE